MADKRIDRNRAGRTPQAPASEARPAADLRIGGRASLEAWLKGQSREAAVAIAARAALRVAPVVRLGASEAFDEKAASQLADLVAGIFRAAALARLAAKYPSRRKELRAAAAADAASSAARATAAATGAAGAAQAERAARAAFAAAYSARVAFAADAPAAAGIAADCAILHPAYVQWQQVLDDATLIARGGTNAAIDAPLWSRGPPPWAADAWAKLKADLPKGEDWEVWIDWYEERLRGGSRGEAVERVFATVPPEVWDKGPAAANAWIKARLPQPKEDDLAQRPALFSFRLADGRIAVAPHSATPEHRAFTQTLLDESRRKAAETRERLERAQADPRLQRTLARLDARLAPPLGDVNAGLVWSSLRALESDVRAYDSEEGRKEHAPDLIAELDDLAATVRDFVSQFPELREIVANQVALALTEAPGALAKAAEASEALAAVAAAHPGLVAPEAPPALREPEEASEAARTPADRAKHLGLRLLTDLNFGRIAAQAREMAVDSWDETRKQVPKAVGKAAGGAVLGGAGLAFGHWAGQDGLTLILAVAGAVGAINAAVGKPGGAFEKLLKTIERIAAKTPAPAPQKPPAPKRPAGKRAAKKTK